MTNPSVDMVKILPQHTMKVQKRNTDIAVLFL